MEITTPGLLLREFVANDWAATLAYQRNPRYLRYYPWEDRTEADARAFVGMFLEWQREQPRHRFQLAVTLPPAPLAEAGDEAGRLIGNCGLRRKPDKEWEADIGYELAPDYWGRGYATEAARAMVNFGFAELGLYRISSWCIAENEASARGCWNGWVSGRKAACAATNASRGAGGIRCSTPSCGRSGKAWANQGDWI